MGAFSELEQVVCEGIHWFMLHLLVDLGQVLKEIQWVCVSSRLFLADRLGK